MGTHAIGSRYILCMKWGSKYGPEYVNRLYAMVRRNLEGDFGFVCLTDNSAGIRSEVQCHPIPPLDLELAPGQQDRAWKKLTTFTKDLYGLQGTALFLDLDVVIVGPMQPFFELSGEVLIIRDYKRAWRIGHKRITGNSSVYRFELGAHADVLENFCANMDAVQSAYRNEQAYLSAFLHRQGKLGYWPEDWCPSFKYQSIPAWPANYWKEPVIPPGARVMVFHGECNPPDALLGKRNRRFGFIKPSTWVSRLWRE